MPVACLLNPAVHSALRETTGEDKIVVISKRDFQSSVTSH